MSTEATAEILKEIQQERDRQDKKWGEQNHPDGTGKEAFKDFADVAKRKCDAAAGKGTLTFAHILEEEFWEALAESDQNKLRTELIQTAAVTVAWVEKIDRDLAKKEKASAAGRAAAVAATDKETVSGKEA